MTKTHKDRHDRRPVMERKSPRRIEPRPQNRLCQFYGEELGDPELGVDRRITKALDEAIFLDWWRN